MLWSVSTTYCSNVGLEPRANDEFGPLASLFDFI